MSYPQEGKREGVCAVSDDLEGRIHMAWHGVTWHEAGAAENTVWHDTVISSSS